ncbi:hypothetical protein [Breznakiella homolactica]|uniref:Uncharacterized protein n=1 Tax=Breznakiella homolactica TaxID=2798577 RepID=A0A7T7XN51_9SPIR|nr:hypothetical protein [Breznakiella homolactica]QQO09406.1 hypothetical protein JFL75_00340 [Breznakiella homolactica]
MKKIQVLIILLAVLLLGSCANGVIPGGDTELPGSLKITVTDIPEKYQSSSIRVSAKDGTALIKDDDNDYYYFYFAGSYEAVPSGGSVSEIIYDINKDTMPLETSASSQYEICLSAEDGNAQTMLMYKRKVSGAGSHTLSFKDFANYGYLPVVISDFPIQLNWKNGIITAADSNNPSDRSSESFFVGTYRGQEVDTKIGTGMSDHIWWSSAARTYTITLSFRNGSIQYEYNGVIRGGDMNGNRLAFKDFTQTVFYTGNREERKTGELGITVTEIPADAPVIQHVFARGDSASYHYPVYGITDNSLTDILCTPSGEIADGTAASEKYEILLSCVELGGDGWDYFSLRYKEPVSGDAFHDLPYSGFERVSK